MSASHATIERRRSRRYALTLPLLVKFQREAILVEKRTETRDVSVRGLYFHLEWPLDAGTAVECVLSLPEQTTHAPDAQIRCYARVVRVDHAGGRYGMAAQIERYEFLPASA
jgi:PilZ domain